MNQSKQTATEKIFPLKWNLFVYFLIILSYIPYYLKTFQNHPKNLSPIAQIGYLKQLFNSTSAEAISENFYRLRNLAGYLTLLCLLLSIIVYKTGAELLIKLMNHIMILVANTSLFLYLASEEDTYMADFMRTEGSARTSYLYIILLLVFLPVILSIIFSFYNTYGMGSRILSWINIIILFGYLYYMNTNFDSLYWPNIRVLFDDQAYLLAKEDFYDALLTGASYCLFPFIALYLVCSFKRFLAPLYISPYTGHLTDDSGKAFPILLRILLFLTGFGFIFFEMTFFGVSALAVMQAVFTSDTPNRSDLILEVVCYLLFYPFMALCAEQILSNIINTRYMPVSVAFYQEHIQSRLDQIEFKIDNPFVYSAPNYHVSRSRLPLVTNIYIYI